LSRFRFDPVNDIQQVLIADGLFEEPLDQGMRFGGP